MFLQRSLKVGCDWPGQKGNHLQLENNLTEDVGKHCTTLVCAATLHKFWATHPHKAKPQPPSSAVPDVDPCILIILCSWLAVGVLLLTTACPPKSGAGRPHPLQPLLKLQAILTATNYFLPLLKLQPSLASLQPLLKPQAIFTCPGWPLEAAAVHTGPSFQLNRWT